ncbi:MAG: trypsin-like peptidase domain-containing protein [Oscillospiraceae bacterium]|jgi:serine protease Do|nr:trypsin-like peptidase domain-containing protein [Oscillospiraceae bacterium]
MDYFDNNDGPISKPTRRIHPLHAGLIYLALGALLGAGLFSLATNKPFPLLGAKTVTIEVASPTAAANPNEEAGTIAWVAEAAAPSVFEVTTENTVTHSFWGSYIESGAGSAVVLSADGYLLTNNHVVAGAQTIRVRDPRGDVYEASVVGTDPSTDVAVLKINASGLTPCVFADSDAVRVGELAVAIGNPLGTLGGTVTEGIVSAKDRAIIVEGEAMVLLQTSAAINPGNSGGGLFNGAGQLIGLVSMKSSGDDIEGLGFAVPSNIVRRVAEELIQYGYVTGRPALGVVVEPITRWNDLQRYGLTEAGLYVINVMKDSPLDLWDMIKSVNGKPVASELDVKSAIGDMKAGDSVSVEVFRKGAYQTISIDLYERTPEMVNADIV